MKKIFLFLSIFLVVFSIHAEEIDMSKYQWTPTKDADNKIIIGGTGSVDFTINFILSSEDNSTYTDVGFSSTPINTNTGAVTKYENNSLLMNATINSNSPYSLDLSCQVYSYWHVAIDKKYSIKLIVEPKENVSVTGSFTKFIQNTSDNYFTNSSVSILDGSKNPIKTATTYDLVSFTTLGRHIGGSLISINANATTAFFPDDVVCTLTLAIVSD